MLVLVTGGARSGKSSFAEELAVGTGGQVTYIATAEAKDGEMTERIARHRRRRPGGWRTVEEPYRVTQVLRGEAERAQIVVIDCLTVWVNNLLFQEDFPAEQEREFQLPPGREQEILQQVEELATVAAAAPAKVIAVTNELGMGLVPAYAAGRIYRDLVGRANQVMARAASEVYLLVAGIPLKIK